MAQLAPGSSTGYILLSTSLGYIEVDWDVKGSSLAYTRVFTVEFVLYECFAQAITSWRRVEYGNKDFPPCFIRLHSLCSSTLWQGYLIVVHAPFSFS